VEVLGEGGGQAIALGGERLQRAEADLEARLLLVDGAGEALSLDDVPTFRRCRCSVSTGCTASLSLAARVHAAVQRDAQ
jgi:hypothetical protein